MGGNKEGFLRINGYKIKVNGDEKRLMGNNHFQRVNGCKRRSISN